MNITQSPIQLTCLGEREGPRGGGGGWCQIGYSILKINDFVRRQEECPLNHFFPLHFTIFHANFVKRKFYVFSRSFKIPFFPMKSIFSVIHWSIYKIRGNGMSYRMWPAKFPILLSTVKLKLGHSFSKSICRFKLGFLNVGLRFSSFSQYTKSLENGSFECCSSWTFQFFIIY